MSLIFKLRQSVHSAHIYYSTVTAPDCSFLTPSEYEDQTPPPLLVGGIFYILCDF